LVIVLKAIRLDAYGQFQYRIEAPNHAPVVTSDPGAVTDLLLQLGVQNPSSLSTHAPGA
jgi:hypothetical protein